MKDIDDGVRGYACAVVGDCSPERISAVSRFDSGERHAVFKVSYVDPAGSATDVVVRVSLSNDDAEREQAEREAAVLEKVQGVAAPRLHDFRRESPWFDAPTMCMQFVAGQQRELVGVGPADVERLGSVVRSVHELSIDDLVEWFPGTGPAAAYRDGRVAEIVSHMTSVRDPLASSVQRRLKRASLLVSNSLEDTRSSGSFTDERLVLLHGDVAAGNVIWDSKPVLIDWEYARIGDPADEIAYLFSQNGLTASQREAFWLGYRRSTDAEDRLDRVADRVRWWEQVTLLGSALWWIERWSRRVEADAAGTVDPAAPRARGYYLDHARRRLDRLDDLLD